MDLAAKRASIGWIAEEDHRITDHNTIVLPPRKPVEQRVASAYAALEQLIDLQQPTHIAYESQANGGNVVPIMCHSYIVALLMVLATCRGIPLIKVAPSSAKKALAGKGNATKAQMMDAVYDALGPSVTEHEADALGVLTFAWRELG